MKKELRSWAIFTGIVVVSALLLLVTDPQPVQLQEESALVDWYAQLDKDQIALPASLDAIVRTDWSLNIDKSWLAGADKLVEMVEAGELKDWDGPPAAMPYEGDGLDLSEYEYLSLEFRPTERFVPPDAEIYVLKVTGLEAPKEYRLPFSMVRSGPFLPGANASFHIRRKSRSCFIFCDNDRVSTLGRTLLTVGSKNAKLKSTRAGVPGLEVDIQILPAVIHQASDDSNSLKPKIVEVEADRLTVHEDSISIFELDASDELFIKRVDQEMVVAIIGTQSLLDKMRCKRDDSPPYVGVYHPEVPVYLVTTHVWASLHCSFHVRKWGEKLNYRILVMNAREAPTKKMALELAGRHLTQMEPNGMPLNSVVVRSLTRWMLTSLDVRFSEADIQQTDSEPMQALMRTLSSLYPGDTL